ncbi:MAG: GAF domain-containing protein [Actinomycetota bacterium]|nr:GAF domain-containing protein [Actinomycetota bacterium]
MNVSIKNRLTITIGLMLALLMLVGMISFGQLVAINNRLEVMANQEEPTSQAAYEMEINLIRMGFAILGYLHDHDELHLDRIAEDKREFKEFQADYGKLAETELEKQLGARVKAGYQDFVELGHSLIEVEKSQQENLDKLAVNQQKMDDILDEGMEPTAKQSAAKSYASGELEINAYEIAATVGNYLHSPEVKYKSKIYKDEGDFRTNLEKYKGLASPSEAALLKELETIFNENMGLVDLILEQDDEIEKKLADLVDLSVNLDNLLDDEIQSLTMKDLATAKASATGLVTGSIIGITILLLIIFTFSIFIGNVTLKSIADPIMSLALAAQAIANGDFSKRVEVMATGDELQELSESFNTMVENLDKVTVSRDYTENILNTLSEALVAVDANGDIETVNPAALNLLGYEEGDLIGRPFNLIFPDEDIKGAPIDPDITACNSMKSVETTYKSRGGTKIPVLLSKTPISERDGEMCGRMVTIATDIAERKKREREMEAIIQVALAMRVAKTHYDIVPIVLDQVSDILRVEAAFLAMYDDVNDELVIELGRGKWIKLTDRHLPPTIKTRSLLKDGEPYLSNDLQKDTAPFAKEMTLDLKAIGISPLIVQGRQIGLIGVGSKNRFTKADLNLLRAVSDMAANAIQRAVLSEQTIQRMNNLSALRSIDTAINSSLDIKVVLNVVLDQAKTALSAGAVSILLVNEVEQTYDFAGGVGFNSAEIHERRLKIGEGLAGKAVMERRIIGTSSISAKEGSDFAVKPVGGEGFVSYHVAPLISKGEAQGLIEVFHRSPFIPGREWIDFLDALAAQAAIAIDNGQLLEKLQRSNAEITMAYEKTLEGWSKALDLRDKETEGHTQRVTEITLRLARKMGIEGEALAHMRRGALLHDIGKMAIPDAILLKKGTLSDEEWEIMRTHPVRAYEMLLPVSFLRAALDIPYCHHERWDGTGYPRGLAGEEIPITARIFALVDVWDALCSDRPYRASWPEEKAREHIKSQSDKHFDPKVVEVFLESEPDLNLG